MWLTKFKIAIVEKDVVKLTELMEHLPTFEEKKDIDSVLCLLKEATQVMTSLKDETQKNMIQIQNNLKFLKATEEKRTSSLDIKS